jgi:hypothetical protein
MPEGAVYVGRPTKWGNPYNWQDVPASVVPFNIDGDTEPATISNAERRRLAVVSFDQALWEGDLPDYPVEQIRTELAGKDLACWCPEGEPCHADVLLKIANGGGR